MKNGLVNQSESSLFFGKGQESTSFIRTPNTSILVSMSCLRSGMEKKNLIINVGFVKRTSVLIPASVSVC